MTQYKLGRLLDERTPHAMALHPAEKLVSTRLRRMYAQNGAWLDQGQYGTCVGNGFAHRRADNPVPITGITEAYAQQLYLDASAIYYGTSDTTMEKGTSVLSGCQVLQNRGTIDKFEWMSDVETLRYTLLERGSIVVGTPWYVSMFDTPPDGLGNQYIRYRPASGQAGGHCYLINGIDLDPLDGSAPFYRMKNSWGKDWGKSGTARFHLADLEALIFTGWGEGVLIHELGG